MLVTKVKAKNPPVKTKDSPVKTEDPHVKAKYPPVKAKDPPINYDPENTYTVEEFELLNDWLKTNELVIRGEPISHFELDANGKLIPMPQTPPYKEGVVAEIVAQLRNWNFNARQNGLVTSSQGGFNVSTAGGKTIRAPDAAFTPKGTYRNLDQQQLMTFRGQPFMPTFVVEVEDVFAAPKLQELDDKFRNEYFPAGVQLGFLVDPVNKEIYTFKRSRSGSVHRRKHGWKDVASGNVLPGFTLEVWDIEEAVSQEPSETSESDDGEHACSTCDEIFSNYYTLIKHIEHEHARKKRRRH